MQILTFWKERKDKFITKVNSQDPAKTDLQGKKT